MSELPAGAALRLLLDRSGRSPSSQSVWLVLRVFDIPFIEQPSPSEAADGDAEPAHPVLGDTVPVLNDRGVVAAGALSILEYLAERFPPLWPEDRPTRARARAVAAELHGGFTSLRRLAGAEPVSAGNLRSLGGEIQRLRAICVGLREAPAAQGGPYLFGRFSAVDAMLAPLTCRALVGALAQDDICRAYLQALDALPAAEEWRAAAGPVAADDHLKLPDALPLPEPTLPPVGAAPKPAEPAPPEIPTVTKPLLRLEDVERPQIAYLDEAPVRSWRAAQLVERIIAAPSIPPVPIRTDAPALPKRVSRPGDPTDRRPAAQPEPPPPVTDPPPGRPPLDPGGRASAVVEDSEVVPAPAGDPAPIEIRPPVPASGETMPLFRLRRPGGNGQPSGLLNRFGQALDTYGAAGGRSDGSALRDPPRTDPDQGGRARPVAIKPIGFSVHRRK